MKVILIFMLFAAGILSSCKPKSDLEIRDLMMQNVPDSVLPIENMIIVLTDIQLAESWVNINKTDTIPKDERLKIYYAQIFDIHETNVRKYQSSYNYYANEPVLMNYIYQKVTEKLNLLESENTNILKQNKK
ncbi:MAG: DUF4296 domain-containing protein [Bacteroidetes bacterium]|nr:DUF4296 domain-containing protein [Bacteroidota bacterium]